MDCVESRNQVKPSWTSCSVHKNVASMNGRTNQNMELITAERHGKRSKEGLVASGPNGPPQLSKLESSQFRAPCFGGPPLARCCHNFPRNRPECFETDAVNKHTKLLMVQLERGITKRLLVMTRTTGGRDGWLTTDMANGQSPNCRRAQHFL